MEVFRLDHVEVKGLLSRAEKEKNMSNMAICIIMLIVTILVIAGLTALYAIGLNRETRYNKLNKRCEGEIPYTHNYRNH